MTDIPANRPLRADARENHERVLRAAARAFAREGTQASLKAIAQDAGVGIATLYRRFPTRELLVEATYRSEVQRVVASVEVLLGDRVPREALRGLDARVHRTARRQVRDGRHPQGRAGRPA